MGAILSISRNGFTGQRVQVNGFDWDAPHRAPRSISWTEQWHFGAGSYNRCGSRSSEHIQKRQRHPPPSKSVNLNSLPCDTPNTHDILTGSQPDGTAFAGTEDRTCGNYTKSGAEGAVMLGHHDRMGLSEDPPAKSWNSSHLSRGGCSPDALKSTGGAGLLYCFAAN